MTKNIRVSAGPLVRYQTSHKLLIENDSSRVFRFLSIPAISLPLRIILILFCAVLSFQLKGRGFPINTSMMTTRLTTI